MIWLYTETNRPMVDGPFYSEVEAMTSFLWEWAGVCVWIETKSARGWTYENVKWNGTMWIITSSGIRPSEPFRPELMGTAVESGG